MYQDSSHFRFLLYYNFSEKTILEEFK